jgi:hypothetical protein
LLKKGEAKAPGAFKAWTATVDACLELVALPDFSPGSGEKEPSDGEKGSPAPDQEQEKAQDVDGDVEDALSMVAALLGGEDVDVDGLSEETLDEYTVALTKHCDYLEASLREKLDEIAGREDATINDIVSVMKVRINGLLYVLSLYIC